MRGAWCMDGFYDKLRAAPHTHTHTHTHAHTNTHTHTHTHKAKSNLKEVGNLKQR